MLRSIRHRSAAFALRPPPPLVHPPLNSTRKNPAARLVAIARCVDEDPTAEAALDAIHDLSLILIEDARGSSVAGLQKFAAAFSKLKPAKPPRAFKPVAHLAAGLALVRARQFEASWAVFSQVRPTGDPLLASLACGFESVALALDGKLPTATQALAEARQTFAPNPPARLSEFLDFTEALLDFRSGRFETALALLTRATAPGSLCWVPDLLAQPRWPIFVAEAHLLLAKLQREFGHYTHAEEALLVSLFHFRAVHDELRETRARLELARIHRFRFDFSPALLALRETVDFVRGSDFLDLQARLEDQLGDICRAQKNLKEAQRHYDNAERLAAKSGNAFLLGHVANSRARLLQDLDRLAEALACLQTHARTWEGTGGHGKYLLLTGSVQADLKNLAEAERLLRQAADKLAANKLTSYAALAFARLGEVLLALDHKEEACAVWAEALMRVKEVEATPLIKRIYERMNKLTAPDLLQIIAKLVRDRAEKDSRTDALQAKFVEVQKRHCLERGLIGHWFAEAIFKCLKHNSGRLLPCFERFSHLLYDGPWRSAALYGGPARATGVVDIPALAAQVCAEVAKELKRPLTVASAGDPIQVPVNAPLLSHALRALFYGVHTAFGTRAFQVSVQKEQSSAGSPPLQWPYRVEVRLVKPKPRQLHRAWELVALEQIWNKDSKLDAFLRRGYSGDLTLLDFIVGLGLCGGIEYQPATDSVVIHLPRAEVEGA